MNPLDIRNRRISTNEDLIGLPGGRQMLDTPCLLIDRPALLRNLERGAELAAKAGKTLLPHLKAHKTPGIADLQKDAGTKGFCVASIGEAEVFADHLDLPMTITSAFATDRQIARVAALANRLTALTIVLDNLSVLRKLSAIDASLSVLIDVDMGRGRSACCEEAQAVHLAREIVEAPNLSFDGLQCYAGQLSHMNAFCDRTRGAAEADRRAASFLNAVKSFAGGPLRCSGGSTGTFSLDLTSKALTELQWGSYALMDVEYQALRDREDHQALPFENALRVATRVISAGHSGHVILDAGDKRFANKYGAAPRILRPQRYRANAFKPKSDEHGEMHGTRLPPLGQIMEVIPPHCDPTVNLFDAVHVVDGNRLVDIWPVVARGVY